MSKKKILVVIDMQNDFVSGVLGTPEAEEATKNTVELLENEADQYDAVVVTMDSHFKETYFQTREGQNLPIFHCPVGEGGWFVESRIANKVCKHKNLTILYKENFGYNNWKETIMDIADIPASSKGEELVIKFVGLVTNMCVIVNVLDIQTLFPETEIIVDAPCCAGTTPEAHEAALAVMESCQIKIINKGI